MPKAQQADEPQPQPQRRQTQRAAASAANKQSAMPTRKHGTPLSTPSKSSLSASGAAHKSGSHAAAAAAAKAKATDTSSPMRPHASAATTTSAVTSATPSLVAARPAASAPSANLEPDDAIHDEVDAAAAATVSRAAHADDEDEAAYSADEAHADTEEGNCIIEESVEHFAAGEKALSAVSQQPASLHASPATSPSNGHHTLKLRQRLRTVSFDSDNLSAREAAVRNARGHSPVAARSAQEIPAAAAAAAAATATTAAATPASIAAAATPYSPSHFSFISASSPSHYRGAPSNISPAFDAYSSACSSPSVSLLSRSSVAMRPPHLALDTQFECSDEYIASMDPMALAMALASEGESNPPTVESRRKSPGSASRKHALRMQARYPQQLQQPQQQQQRSQPPLFTRATRLDAHMVVSDSEDYSDNYSDSDREDGADAAPRSRRAPLPVALPRASAPPPIPSAIPCPSASTSAQASPALLPVASTTGTGSRPSPTQAHRRAMVSPPASSKKQLAPSPSLPTLGAKRSSDPMSLSNGGSDREPPHTPPTASSSFTAASPSSHGGGTAFPTLGRSSSSAVLSPSSSAAQARAVLSPSRRTQSSLLPAAVTPQAALRLKR